MASASNGGQRRLWRSAVALACAGACAIGLASGAPSLAAGANPATGYASLNGESLVQFQGLALICVVETLTGHPSQLVGIECGPGSGGDVRSGTYWVSARLPDGVVAAKASAGRPLGTIEYQRPAHQTLQTSIGVPGYKAVELPLPSVMRVGTTHLWCAATTVSSGPSKGLSSVTCFEGTSDGAAVDGSLGFVVSTGFAAAVKVHGTSVQKLWERNQPN